MPVFYRETVIDPENSQKLPYKQQQQQSFYQSNGQQHPYQQSKTSNTYPGSERSSGIYKGNGSSSANTTTTATDFPANFPKIPPPKGVIDNKQLERMAEQLMKGQQPTWDGQQYSPPGWTRHSQQSYTIETVVEHEPETRPIYVGKHYESVPPKTGILPQTHPKHQYSPSQQIPTKTTKQPPPPPSSQIYRQPQFQEKYNYQPPEQQYYNKTVQQKQQIPPVEPQKQFPPQQQQQKYFPPQQIPQQQKPSATIIEERQEKKSTSVVDSTNFPSQQYTKTLTEYMKQTNGYDSQKKEGGGGGGLQQTQKQIQEPRQEEWQQQKIINTSQQSPQNKLESQQKQWESIQSPHEKWKWSQTQQWSSQQQPQQTQQQWEQQTLQWQQAQQQPAEQWGQSQQHWKQTPQQAKENEGQQSQQWQQTQKYATQQQQNLLKQETQQQQTQQYSPQKAQNELKQQTTETNIQAQQSQKQSGTSKVEQKEREQKIEQDVGDEYDGPPPDLQLAQADPDKLYEKQHEVYQNGWQQEEDYHQQPYRSHHLNQRQLQQTRNNYDEPLYISAGGDDGYQQQYHQYYSPNSQIYWDSVYNDEWALRGANPPSFTTGPVWGDHLAYAQRMNLEKRRTESEKQRRHHTPVPGSAEYGYLFGGMDFVDHNNFDPSINVGEPFNEMQERHSRRDLHWGPPRRRGDFFGLDYRTMLPEEEQHRSHSAEDSAFYQGYQALPPRKNFRLVGHFTADHNAPLNMKAEAQGLDEFDSQYWVGDTLSNQKVRPEYPLTEEEKRTFALLYGPGGFKPDHRTVIPEPKPEEPVQFSVTIGPKKEKKEQQQAEGYVNPMKVEGESWMLGQRGEYDGQYGKILHSTAEQHLPFHSPKHFPARVPNWAVERQNQMGRGARSLDRSLFLPSWAKIPQPQPPFWVKRDGSKVAGNWQVPKQQQQSQIQEQQQEQFVQQQKSQPPQQKQQQQQYVANQQIINSPQQKEENRLPQPSPTQQPSPQQKQKAQQIQKLPSPTEQKQPAKEEADKNLQKSKQQIFTQSHQQSHPNYQQQTNVTTTTYTQNQQIQSPINTQHSQPEQKPLHQGFTSAPTAQNQQQFTQLIITPSKTHQTTFKPAKQPLTSSQEQQQQLKQQQQYSNFYEGRGQTQKTGPQQEQFKQFTSPGGQFYGQQKAEGKAPQHQYIVNQANQPQYYGRMPQQQQQQYQYRMQQQHPQLHKGGGYTKTPQNYPQGQIVEEEEEKSGLENLAKMKLGKFPMRESLEAQQSLESNNDQVDSSNIKRQQFVRSGQPGQVIREEWRFSSGQPQKG
uniref:Uncharacterized protein n=1 Tax=Meloidogyne incognita TaxID=6306 RepID=A0A914KHL1_MELIC